MRASRILSWSALQSPPDSGADHRPGRRADGEQKGEHEVYCMVLRGLQHGDEHTRAEDLEKTGSRCHVYPHTEHIEHQREHDETAAHTHHRRKYPG